MSRPIILDLFCGAGGAAMGYYRAGFDVVGIDLMEQPNYPFEFIRGDALDTSIWPEDVDAIHASPPCQAYSTQTQHRSRHPRMIAATREALTAARPAVQYVIENVEAAKSELIDPIRLCGSSFGLDLRRHRLFESNLSLAAMACSHRWQTPRFRSLNIAQHRAGVLASVVGVHGHINYPGEFPIRCAAMGIDWMTNDELVESIPPAYTQFVGRQILNHLQGGT